MDSHTSDRKRALKLLSKTKTDILKMQKEASRGSKPHGGKKENDQMDEDEDEDEDEEDEEEKATDASEQQSGKKGDGQMDGDGETENTGVIKGLKTQCGIKDDEHMGDSGETEATGDDFMASHDENEGSDESDEEPDELHQNPWDMTSTVAEGILKNKKESAKQLCINVLKEVVLWTPSLVVATVCRRLQDIQAIMDASPSEDKTVKQEIQKQVSDLINCSKRSGLAQVETLYWLAKIARTINTHEGPKKQGRDARSDIYDKYVEAEYATHNGYEHTKATNPNEINSKRKAWSRNKQTGDKLLKFVNTYGLGVLICLPSHITKSTVERWTIPFVTMLLHGISKGPCYTQFMSLCSTTTAWFDYVIQSELVTKDIQQSMSDEIATSMSTKYIFPVDHDQAKMIELFINSFPNGRPLAVGAFSACPDISDLETLRPGGLINDEVIRTVLGIKYEKLDKNRQEQLKVFDPSYLVEKAEKVKALKPQVTHALFAFHHKFPVEHWTTVTLDVKSRVAEHQDSLPNTGNVRDRQTRDQVFGWLSKADMRSQDQEWT